MLTASDEGRTGRPAGTAANQILVRHQSKDRESDRPHDPANAPCSRRRGDRVSRGTAGVPEGVLLRSNGTSRGLTTSRAKRPAAPSLRLTEAYEICQHLTD